MLRMLLSRRTASRLEWSAKAAASCLQACTDTSTCCYSSSTPDGHENFIGAYTPVTKQLWEERLALADRKQKQQGSSNSSKSGNSGSDQKDNNASSSGKPPEVTQVSYAFTTNRTLEELYKNPWGYVRIGRVLEDLDSLAGSIAFAHCRCPTNGTYPALVTAAVDAINLRHPLQIRRDAQMRGQVVWTGRTALDIRMELLQEPHDPEPSLLAIFSFVALDWATRRPTPVPQLLPRTLQEQQWAAERQQLAQQRKAARQAAGEQQQEASLTKEQCCRLDELDAASRLLQDMPALADPHHILMGATRLANTFTCQPQQRNMQGAVFGGFLMRRAFELAFATTHLFAGARPTFLLVDEITFRKPVAVGDLLRLESHILGADVLQPQQQPVQLAGVQQAQHTTSASGRTADVDCSKVPWRVVVDVEAMVGRPEQRTSWPTNTFRFVFQVSLPVGERLRQVLPGSAADVARLKAYWAS